MLLSCGGGGGGGGASLGGGSSLGGTKTLSIDINELMGTSRASSRPNLDWKQIDLTVYINDEVVYDEQIPRGNNDVIRIENVKIGSMARAKAAVWVEGEADARQAESETITVQVGTNKMTLYVPYKYTITDTSGNVETYWYTSRDGIPLPELVSDDERYSTNYTDENAVPYAVGTVKGVRGDQKKFYAAQVNKYPFELIEGDEYYTVGAFDPARPETKIVIPDSINGRPVKSIAANAFAGYTQITSVTLPEGLTEIEPDAFNGCTGLTSITLPSNVTTIGNRAFQNTGLTSINLSHVQSVGSETFRGCVNLQNVTFSNSLTAIYSNAFEGCTRLSSVIVPGGDVESNAFANCTGLTAVTVNGSGRIGGAAFMGCTELITVSLSDTITEIGTYAFSGCTKLSNINIPNSVAMLTQYTFESCSLLTSINTNQVTTIEPNCFSNSGLQHITIPSVSFSSLDVTAFNGSTDLGTITFGGTAAPTISGICSSVIVLGRVYFPGGLVATANRPSFITDMQSSFITAFPGNVVPDIEFIE